MHGHESQERLALYAGGDPADAGPSTGRRGYREYVIGEWFGRGPGRESLLGGQSGYPGPHQISRAGVRHAGDSSQRTGGWRVSDSDAGERLSEDGPDP